MLATVSSNWPKACLATLGFSVSVDKGREYFPHFSSLVVLYDGDFRPHLRLIDAKMAEMIAREGLPEIRNLRFGDRFTLKALVPRWSNTGLEVDLAGQSLRKQPLDFIQAVHFVDKNGAQLIGVSYLGLGIYRLDENLIPVSGGVMDWNGGRLLVSLAGELAVPSLPPLNRTREVDLNRQAENNEDSAEGD
jgi:hypothetical protein